MAVTVTATITQHAGNASTVTAYPTVFPFQENSWLSVWVTTASGVTSQLTLGSDYTLTGAGTEAGGNLTTLAAIPATSTLTIARVTPRTQLLDLTFNDRLPSAQVEAGLDKIVLMIQELTGRKSLLFPLVEPVDNDNELPPPADRKGTVFGFDETTGEAVLYELPLPIVPLTPPDAGTYVLTAIDGVLSWTGTVNCA